MNPHLLARRKLGRRFVVQISVNGKQMSTNARTVSDLLESLQLVSERIAVERNKLLIARSTFTTERLEEGDELELVTFVGGG